MKVILRNIQYHPDIGQVAMYIEAPKPLGPFYAIATQAQLLAHAPAGSPSDYNWGDAEALAAAQAFIDADPDLSQWSFTVAFPDPPAPPTPPEVIT